VAISYSFNFIELRSLVPLAILMPLQAIHQTNDRGVGTKALAANINMYLETKI